jgi:hypothetical protein
LESVLTRQRATCPGCARKGGQQRSPAGIRDPVDSRSERWPRGVTLVPKLMTWRSSPRPAYVRPVLRDQLRDNRAGHGQRATDVHGRCQATHLRVPARPVIKSVASGRRGRLASAAPPARTTGGAAYGPRSPDVSGQRRAVRTHGAARPAVRSAAGPGIRDLRAESDPCGEGEPPQCCPNPGG